MKATAHNQLKLSLAACAAGLLFSTAGSALGHPHSGTRGAMGYSEQRQACSEGATWQQRRTCLREAAAAQQAARRGALHKPNEDYTKNALRRCNALPQADRDECAARIAHPTSTSGSVADGGILYEYREIVPAGTPGSTVVPGSSVEPAAVVTPGGQVKPGVVVEMPAGTKQPGSARPAR